MIFDTHAHYDDDAFDEDRDELLSDIFNSEIKRIVNVASGMHSCETTLKLAEQYDFIYAAVGVHPSETADLDENDMKKLEAMCSNPKVVAIGEIGLDYHWPEPKSEHQKKFFIRQLELAKDKDLPVIIHSRDAAADTMDIMKNTAKGLRGVIHCYSYSAEQALEYVKMGYYIGIGGVVTFKNARKLVECVEKLPLSSIVLETDCPYLSPEPFRGKRNNSSFLPFVVEKIAEIKNIAPQEVKRVTFENALNLYKMGQVNE